MFFQNIALNYIVKNWKTSHRENIASLRKVNIAHPYPTTGQKENFEQLSKVLSKEFPFL